MKPFEKLKSHALPLLADDVDTDQIIPARFLKTIDKAGLAEGLFAEWRKNPGFVLHKPEHAGAQILIAGRNFGCGSSREHAPWALEAGGFRAVIALGFADIFRGNATRNGVLPVALAPEPHAALIAAVQANPKIEIEIDLENERVKWNGCTATFPIDEFAKHCLVQGIDELGYLVAYADRIRAFERRHDLESLAGGVEATS
ncbi:3-isopropylmalate dehydratase small subunit [Sandaracinus amylolyticus]|uniref:3-isopropylmalate dehydratase small subunit n=1 Tax=Sandaracinus amylolyticus TaxID=927083 RepID=UPI001F026EDC|nr:3-isopropylmalate dehydratase small subunit [Sandaracinus amylolyticus]UJR79331.1 3-isopropylmalate dehydratase small subunit [Sandaracinus amylolyticus]